LTNKLVIENLRFRPVRTVLSVLAIGIEVVMILTIVGISRGMIVDSQRRMRGVGADVLVRPPGSSVLSLSSAPIPEKMVGFIERQPHERRGGRQQRQQIARQLVGRERQEYQSKRQPQKQEPAAALLWIIASNSLATPITVGMLSALPLKNRTFLSAPP